MGHGSGLEALLNRGQHDWRGLDGSHSGKTSTGGTIFALQLWFEKSDLNKPPVIEKPMRRHGLGFKPETTAGGDPGKTSLQRGWTRTDTSILSSPCFPMARDLIRGIHMVSQNR